MMIGSTMKAKVTQPASSDTFQLNATTNRPKPNRPKTIDGTPARLAIESRTNRMNGPSFAYSLR